MECQPLELDHQTSNVVDCKKTNPRGTNMRTKTKSLCVYMKGEEEEDKEEEALQGKSIHSVSKKQLCVLSFKTACEHVVYLCVHGSVNV